MANWSEVYRPRQCQYECQPKRQQECQQSDQWDWQHPSSYRRPLQCQQVHQHKWRWRRCRSSSLQLNLTPSVTPARPAAAAPARDLATAMPAMPWARSDGSGWLARGGRETLHWAKAGRTGQRWAASAGLLGNAGQRSRQRASSHSEFRSFRWSWVGRCSRLDCPRQPRQHPAIAASPPDNSRYAKRV